MSTVKENLEISRWGMVDGVYKWRVYDPDTADFYLLDDDMMMLMRKLGRGDTALQQDEIPGYEYLRGLGLLRSPPPPLKPVNKVMSVMGNLFMLRVHLLDPTWLTTQMRFWCLFFTSRPFLALATTFTLVSWFRLLPLGGQLFTWDYRMSDLPLYLTLLFLIKVIHEAGHACAAARFNVEVRSMGVALVFFTPRLFTDGSDAWRRSSRVRGLMAVAGIWAEFILSGICAWYMSISSPGGDDWRLAKALFLTTTINTLLFNGNFFMKFDGYHALASWWERPNLQEGALKQVKVIYDWIAYGAPIQQQLSPMVVVYGVGTWCYRIFLYTSIILFLFHFDFKPLAYLLAVCEVSFFILLPCLKSMKEGKEKMKKAKWRALPAVLIPLLVIGLCFVPWSWERQVKALVSEQQPRQLASPAAGVLEWKHDDGDTVKAGDLLVRVRNIEREKQVMLLEQKLEEAKIKVAGSPLDPGVNAVWSSRQIEIERDLTSAIAARERCEIRAPADGVLHLPKHLDSVGVNTPLGAVMSSDRVLRIIVPASDQELFAGGSNLRFALAAAGSELPLAASLQPKGPVLTLSGTPLAASAGGPLATGRDGAPLEPQIEFTVPAPTGMCSGQVGVVLYSSHFCLAKWFWQTLQRELIR